MDFNCKLDVFLSNKNNKVQLIDSLANELRSRGHHCIRRDDDADKTVVSKSLEIAGQGHHTTVVVNDRYISVTLNMWTPPM